MALIFAGLWFVLLAIKDYLSAIRFVQLPLHSTLETIGGLSAIWIAAVLFHHKEDDADICFWVGNGFACKGILDIFHAVCMPGESFIFLNSTANLSAALLFSLIWLPRHVIKRYALEQRWLTVGVIIISISVGFRAVLFPEGVPHIIHLYNNQFTLVSITMNNIAAILFLTSIPRWVTLYHQSGHRYYLLFLSVCFLFGTSEVIFQYSDLWDGIWWSWHIIQLAAHIITLMYLFHKYKMLNNEVYYIRWNQEQPEQLT
ncbi:MAG: hypothetical protein OMM_02279 [Candidatus Magnetoglobus multicellularis str. Araruama]|uniref:Uncharacterized protein n=1 Tax=Candidatus Magnetoglobus multicellularis str. Araruama TaxID=890399 RepID=A0A1V1P9Y9_9BACT|nr:MAG: hypothetical protein OMM_02279 [Candidatus Magnetoglobus multicellularis str. Araruama]